MQTKLIKERTGWSKTKGGIQYMFVYDARRSVKKKEAELRL